MDFTAVRTRMRDIDIAPFVKAVDLMVVMVDEFSLVKEMESAKGLPVHFSGLKLITRQDM